MLLQAILDVLALLSAFILGVIFSLPVKKALGLYEEDLKVEVGLLRTDVNQIAEGLERRIKDIENRLSK